MWRRFAYLLIPFSALGILLPQAAGAGSAEQFLPPLAAWSGQSRELALPPDAHWATPAERSGLTRTPSYDETVAWLQELAAASREISLVGLGRSGEGREIWMVVASRDGAEAQALIHGGKPTLLAHAGIHSGEIDGKDAGLMLLRDMTVRGTLSRLLDHANFLFIPILNVDGHERFSPYGRINQRGPEEMGWRTNRRNLNLNRDFAKQETPGVRALTRVLNEWQPDLYFDIHVTDGADYQYDITYGWNGVHAWSPEISRWLDEVLRPKLHRSLTSQGHIPGPLILATNWRDLSAGFLGWTAGPRYSHGYGDARHLPSVLVENHSLKPFAQRVLGTYVLLAAALETVAEQADTLRSATANDRSRRRSDLPLGFGAVRDRPSPTVPFKAIRSELELSAVSGGLVPRWTGERLEIEAAVIPFTRRVATANRPLAYYIPPAWNDIAERLEAHGIVVEHLEEPRTVEVERYRLPDAALDVADGPYEGRTRVAAGEVIREVQGLEIGPGWRRVDTDQPLGDLAMLLLEPESPDSYFQWGYFLEILHRTEYAESYVLEPMARAMLADDPELAAEFHAKLLAEPEFAGDPKARLHWFYEKTPYFDREYRLYPIARELGPVHTTSVGAVPAEK